MVTKCDVSSLEREGSDVVVVVASTSSWLEATTLSEAVSGELPSSWVESALASSNGLFSKSLKESSVICSSMVSPVISTTSFSKTGSTAPSSPIIVDFVRFLRRFFLVAEASFKLLFTSSCISSSSIATTSSAEAVSTLCFLRRRLLFFVPPCVSLSPSSSLTIVSVVNGTSVISETASLPPLFLLLFFFDTDDETSCFSFVVSKPSCAERVDEMLPRFFRFL